jgi:hypothetical protein
MDCELCLLAFAPLPKLWRPIKGGEGVDWTLYSGPLVAKKQRLVYVQWHALRVTNLANGATEFDVHCIANIRSGNSALRCAIHSL